MMSSAVVRSPGIQVSPQRLTEVSTFTSSAGHVAKVYLNNNPWKISSHNDHQKVFRYCWHCGEDRFGDERWNHLHIALSDSAKFCHRKPCENSSEAVCNIVPHYLFLVQTDKDKALVTLARSQEFYEQTEI